MTTDLTLSNCLVCLDHRTYFVVITILWLVKNLSIVSLLRAFDDFDDRSYYGRTVSISYLFDITYLEFIHIILLTVAER